MTADPNTVVALTSALLPGSVSTQSGSIRSTQNSSDGFEYRTSAILDALAALRVREPKPEVIAIGCRLTEPNVELIIASNNGPPASTRNHLKSIWKSLTTISNRKFSGEELSADLLTESPPFKVYSVNNSSLNKLLIDVYKHSSKVVEKRHAKYWPIVEEFCNQYCGFIENEESLVSHGKPVSEWKHKGLFEQFKILMGTITAMNKMLLKFRKNAWVLSPDEVKTLFNAWWYIFELGTEVLKKYTCLRHMGE